MISVHDDDTHPKFSFVVPVFHKLPRTNFLMILTLLTFLVLLDSSYCTEPPTKRVRVSELTEEEPDDEPEYRAVENVAIYSNGLLAEKYNHSIVEDFYGEDFSRILSGLIIRDRNLSASIPNRNATVFDNQRVANHQVKLAKTLSRATQSSLFLAQLNGKPVVIKYQANCIELGSESSFIRRNYSPYIHPLLVETMFTMRAAKLGIAPNLYFLSPPTTLCESKKGICSFTMHNDWYTRCAKHPHASMRFVVSEFVHGVSLYHYKIRYMSSGIPLEKALRIGEQLVALLERLHTEARVVHGDIHAGNIMIHETADGKNISLKLIDFGRATANQLRSELEIREPFWASHPLYSAWEILGFTPSARDDIARAVQTIARMVFSAEYETHEGLIEDISVEELVKWKLEVNFFDYPGFDPLEKVIGLNDILKTEFRSHLQRVVELVQSMKQVNSIPPYAEIRSALMAARQIVVTIP